MKHVLMGMVRSVAAPLVVAGSLWGGLAAIASAQTILQEQGTIAPAEQSYPLELQPGDVVTIILTSEEFDTILNLVGPDGEVIATNDDYGGTLNSRIVFNAETAGNYQIVAKSFDGTGGNFALEVRPATPYEVALNDAQVSLQAGDFDAAIAAYGEAIALEPENPEPYIARAESYIGKTQVELESQGRFLESPDDLPADAKSAIVADFEQAAQLYQEAGDAFTAQSLREQIEYIQTGEIPGPNGGGPRPEGAEPM